MVKKLVFVKKVVRKNPTLGDRVYYYLCLKFREDKKAKDRILRRLTTSEILEYEKNKTIPGKGEVFSPSSETKEEVHHYAGETVSQDGVADRLQSLIDDIFNRKPPFNAAIRPQKLAREFLEPILKEEDESDTTTENA